MNILALAHATIRAKFWTRIVSFSYLIVGYVLLAVVDWRLPLGVYLVTLGQQMRQTTGGS